MLAAGWSAIDAKTTSASSAWLCGLQPLVTTIHVPFNPVALHSASNTFLASSTDGLKASLGVSTLIIVASLSICPLDFEQ